MNLAAVMRQVGLDGLGHEGGHRRAGPSQLVIVVGGLGGLIGSRRPANQRRVVRIK